MILSCSMPFAQKRSRCGVRHTSYSYRPRNPGEHWLPRGSCKLPDSYPHLSPCCSSWKEPFIHNRQFLIIQCILGRIEIVDICIQYIESIGVHRVPRNFLCPSITAFPWKRFGIQGRRRCRNTSGCCLHRRCSTHRTDLRHFLWTCSSSGRSHPVHGP